MRNGCSRRNATAGYAPQASNHRLAGRVPGSPVLLHFFTTRASLAVHRLVAGEGAGSLAEMFRLALTDFPQWSPTALSVDPPIVQARR